MKEGWITRWYVKEGEPIQEGEFLLEVLTKKAIFKVESPLTGTLYKVLTTAGNAVPVHSPVAILAEAGDELAVLEKMAGEALEKVNSNA